MKEITDECVSCGLPCLGNSCPYSKVTRWYCDECKDECQPEELYVTEDGDTLCQDCLLEKFQTVAQVGEDSFN